jgi:hypothetical protein
MLLRLKTFVRIWPLAVAVAAAVLIALLARRSPPEDSIRSPLSQLPAEGESAAEFVGTQKCAECHPVEYAKYLRSGHSKTFEHTKDSSIARGLDGRQFHDPQRGVTFHYHFDANGLSVTLPEKFGDKPFPLDYALGSGEHAMTFLTLVPNRGGETVGIEHRVSYFGSTHALGLTPSHRTLPAQQDVEQFGRVHKGDKLTGCIGCHTTTAEIGDQELVDLRANVGCESCHGPGRAHVTAEERNQPGATIAFGGHNRTAAEQVQVCGRCHRLPEMITSGITRDNARLARFQPVGLLQSACYVKSAGRLSCTTCHDPHRHVSRDRDDYVAACVACHQPKAENARVCRVSPESGCIECHMPGIEVHPGIVFHDHWIRVRGEGEPQAAKERPEAED